ncbi:hypothetical protein PIIN_00690 [Serendipita indica DSM 11827]|uniref:MYND-type domain-containing protein n=1 Tax=Serendipita indica (strain DSM 11827) TaxID=1109443 RepID=G4U311_SERID|nr:hypothetical protein PIIN_00690 [Serendipita indica DSM 11827]
MSPIAPNKVKDAINLLHGKIGKHSREDLALVSQHICSSSIFWQKFTAANLEETKSRHRQHKHLQSLILPIQAIMYNPRTMLSFQESLVENLANSSVFDYLDEAADEETKLMFLNDLKNALESANGSTRQAMGKQMPRARLLHTLVISNSQWIPVIQIQNMVMDPVRCNRRGCEKSGNSQCARCASRYCSADYQKQDWAEHKLVCKLLPGLKSKVQSA